MSEINYWLITNRIGQLIKDNLPTIGDSQIPVNVYIEQPLNLITSRGHQVYIYQKGWDSPADEELLGSGRHFRTFLDYELWLFVHALDSDVGMPLRDRFMQKVKEIFKTPVNRQFMGEGDGSVLVTRFKGGEFFAPDGGNSKTEKNPIGGFWYGVNMKLQAEVRE